jgi:hypothetical protein
MNRLRSSFHFSLLKGTFIISLAVLLFSGCSQKHTAQIDETVDIVAGKDIVRPGPGPEKLVLSVKKRDGNSLEGIRVVVSQPDGNERIITADTGTVTQGPRQTVEGQPADAKTQERLKVVFVRNPVKVTLFNATVQTHTQDGTTRIIVDRMDLDF